MKGLVKFEQDHKVLLASHKLILQKGREKRKRKKQNGERKLQRYWIIIYRRKKKRGLIKVSKLRKVM